MPQIVCQKDNQALLLVTRILENLLLIYIKCHQFTLNS